MFSRVRSGLSFLIPELRQGSRYRETRTSDVCFTRSTVRIPRSTTNKLQDLHC